MYSRRRGRWFSSCVHHFHRCIRRCRCRRGSEANIRPVNIGDRCTAISFSASSKFRCWWSRSIGRSARLWCKRPAGWRGHSRSRCWWHLAGSTFRPVPVETSQFQYLNVSKKAVSVFYLAHERPAGISETSVASSAIESGAEHVVGQTVERKEKRPLTTLLCRHQGQLNFLQGVSCWGTFS